METMCLQRKSRLCLMAAILVLLAWKVVIPVTKQHINSDQFPNIQRMTMDKTLSNIQITKNKVMHIGFLKVHKTGSSTMKNIFFRFGTKHNLTFVLPTTGVIFSNKSNIMAIEPDSHYDILAGHSVYSPELWESVLPPNSIYIGIVREPLDRMISAAYYFRDVISVDYLKQIPDDLIRNLVNFPNTYDRGYFSKTRNAMGKDFGFSINTSINDKKVIKNHLENLKRRFSLVLITERFDESLVLMKRLLKWSISDIIYRKTKVHEHEHVYINDAEKKKFRSTCFLDYALYDTFVDIFDTRVKAEGADFHEELSDFKSILETINRYCTDGVNLTPLQVNETKWHAKLTVTKTDCKLLKNVRCMMERHNIQHNI